MAYGRGGGLGMTIETGGLQYDLCLGAALTWNPGLGLYLSIYLSICLSVYLSISIHWDLWWTAVSFCAVSALYFTVAVILTMLLKIEQNWLTWKLNKYSTPCCNCISMRVGIIRGFCSSLYVWNMLGAPPLPLSSHQAASWAARIWLRRLLPYLAKLPTYLLLKFCFDIFI